LATVITLSLVVSIFFMEGWISTAASQLRQISLNFSFGAGSARAELQRAIADLRAQRFDGDEFDKALVLVQPPNVFGQRLTALGELKDIDLLSSEGAHYVYQVAFAQGNTIWVIDLAPSGKIGRLSVQF